MYTVNVDHTLTPRNFDPGFKVTLMNKDLDTFHAITKDVHGHAVLCPPLLLSADNDHPRLKLTPLLNAVTVFLPLRRTDNLWSSSCCS